MSCPKTFTRRLFLRAGKEEQYFNTSRRISDARIQMLDLFVPDFLPLYIFVLTFDFRYLVYPFRYSICRVVPLVVVFFLFSDESESGCTMYVVRCMEKYVLKPR